MPKDFENVSLLGKTGSDRRTVKITLLTEADIGPISVLSRLSAISRSPPSRNLL